MAIWVQENLGLEPEKELDRIDNDRHYEPGNLRWSTPAQNLAHTRKRMISAELHAFRTAHPEIRYADATLRRMLGEMTWPEVIERFHQYSCKPKGVYGTFSTPDPFIASQRKVS